MGNLFDILGPVMVGPSSSHTAGAARIGLIARQLFGRQPDKAIVNLHGSFAATGKGHGTDKALIAGLLGMKPDDLRIPHSFDIAKEMGVKREAVVIALEAIVEPVSLYEPVYFDAGDTIYVMDQIGDNNSDIDWIDEILLKKAINNLGEREKNILSLRFMNGMTQTEVAKEIGISQAQVSRLEKGALDKIKSHKKIYI